MSRRLIVIMITVVTLGVSALGLVARGGQVDADGGVIKAEVNGRLHFQEGQGYFISVKSREHPGWENRVWLWISENKVMARQLQGLDERNVTARGQLEQWPENVHGSVPPHEMYFTKLQQIEAAK